MLEREFYTIYETTNLVNGNKYRGVHKTSDPYDRYLGSGTLLKKAVRKYGRSSFCKVILFCAFTESDSYKIEEILVDKEWCDRIDTYNIVVGGTGAVGSLNKGKKLSKEHAAKGAASRVGRIFTEETRAKISAAHKGRPKSEAHRKKHSEAMRGRKASVEIKIKMSKSNSGLRWITDGTANSKVRDLSLMPEGWYIGKTIYRTQHTKGWVFITDGITTTCVEPSSPLPLGWEYGRRKTSKKPAQRLKSAMLLMQNSAPNMCLKFIEEYKQWHLNQLTQTKRIKAVILSHEIIQYRRRVAVKLV